MASQSFWTWPATLNYSKDPQMNTNLKFTGKWREPTSKSGFSLELHYFCSKIQEILFFKTVLFTSFQPINFFLFLETIGIYSHLKPTVFGSTICPRNSWSLKECESNDVVKCRRFSICFWAVTIWTNLCNWKKLTICLRLIGVESLCFNLLYS